MNNWDDRPTAVYYLFDSDDRLLYVGITFDPSQRFASHSREMPWWPEVVRRDVRWYGTRPEAEAVEIATIERADPPYNTEHSPTAAAKRAQRWTKHLKPVPSVPQAPISAEDAARLAAEKVAAMDRLRAKAEVVGRHDAERRELVAAIVAARQADLKPFEIQAEVSYDRNHVGKILKAAGLTQPKGHRSES